MSLRRLSTIFAAWMLWQSVPARGQERPNVVLIMADDMGFSDIGCYGGEIHTPNLDRLAANGVRHTQFYNNGRCCPTRASLLTGLYPHQAHVGHMMEALEDAEGRPLPSYAGDLNLDAVTIPEAIQGAGYRSYMAGKWHVTRAEFDDDDLHNWPPQRGFDRFYGTITGAGSFYDPSRLFRDNTLLSPYADPEYTPEHYYYTDAITDHAIRFVREHGAEPAGEPFFLYVSYTAAHWPMHALPDDIERYKGVYDGGYDATRSARVERMRAMGLIDPAWDVTTTVGDWASKDKIRDWELRCMEVYAAMVDRMDQGIGRIVEQLEDQGILDNTLILYLQDNGGCAELTGRPADVNDRRYVPDDTVEPMSPTTPQPKHIPPMRTRDGHWVRGGPSQMPGGPESYIAYGQAWANVSNTPFREYKHFVHEGGIATPLIAHWPSGLAPELRGGFNREPAHLIDLMATVVDLAEAEYPETIRGHAVPAREGISLRPAWSGHELGRTSPIFWEHEGNRAVRAGDWKLVAKGIEGPWELYDMARDRTETDDLAERFPNVARRLADAWEGWAERAGVLPFPDARFWRVEGR